MKKIISLYGKAQCGKTSTLRMLYEDLIKLGSISIIPLSPKGDAQCLLEYNGTIIAICTGGDTEDVIVENCAFFDKTKCDIAISATRTKGATTYELNEYAKRLGLQVNWAKKNIAHIMKMEVNKAQVKDLIAIIDR